MISLQEMAIQRAIQKYLSYKVFETVADHWITVKGALDKHLKAAVTTDSGFQS